MPLLIKAPADGVMGKLTAPPLPANDPYLLDGRKAALMRVGPNVPFGAEIDTTDAMPVAVRAPIVGVMGTSTATTAWWSATKTLAHGSAADCVTVTVPVADKGTDLKNIDTEPSGVPNAVMKALLDAF